MSDSFIQLPPNSTGLKLDTSQLTVGANTVQRERMIIADNTNNNYAIVSATGGLLVDQGAANATPWNVIAAQATAANLNATVVFPAAQHVIIDSAALGTVTVSGSVAATLVKVSQSPAAPAAATVGVTTGQILAANSSRTGLVLINTSANTISLGFGAAAVLNSGITLNPNGGTFVMDSFTFTTAAVNAIASVASSNISIEEYS
jgi:hypothetical protein